MEKREREPKPKPLHNEKNISRAPKLTTFPPPPSTFPMKGKKKTSTSNPLPPLQ